MRRCDRGFGGENCVSMKALPTNLALDFDVDVDDVVLSGGQLSDACGVLQSGRAAVFHQVFHCSLVNSN